MSTNRTIEELFQDEDLPQVDLRNKELPRIPIPPLDKPKEPRNQAKANGIEKREFTRIDIAEKKLELRFTNQLQFARQYIENISMGGLFVKTELKPKMGDMIPIEFSVPTPQGARVFQLRSKVCRVSPGGVGLEFLQVPNEIRTALESFVGTILPQGMSLNTKSKASTLEVLENIRAEKRKAKEAHRRLAYKIAVIALLVAFNLIQLKSLTTETSDEHSVEPSPQTLNINGKTIKTNRIQSISSLGHERFEIQMDDGQTLTVGMHDLDGQLPYELRETFETLNSYTIPPPPRTSQNTSLTQLR